MQCKANGPSDGEEKRRRGHSVAVARADATKRGWVEKEHHGVRRKRLVDQRGDASDRVLVDADREGRQPTGNSGGRIGQFAVVEDVRS